MSTSSGPLQYRIRFSIRIENRIPFLDTWELAVISDWQSKRHSGRREMGLFFDMFIDLTRFNANYYHIFLIETLR